MSYRTLHARRYDELYADKPYDREAKLTADALARRGIEGGRLLDVACGTGRHAAEFLKTGWQVTGVDLNPDLLEHARLNAPGATFHQQDMRELSLPGERFDAITCLFDALGYVVSDDDVVKALSSMTEHLADRGAVAVEVLHAPALVANASPLGVRRLELADGTQLVRIAETTVDPEHATMTVSYELIELEPGGGWERDTEQQNNRGFTVEELERLFAASGLQLEEAIDSRADDQVTDATWHVLAVGRRA